LPIRIIRFVWSWASKKTASNMADVGLKISQPLYDANTAADYQLLFNSSWPSVTIGYESTQTIALASGGVTPTFTHDLNFPPFSMMWTTINGMMVDFRLPYLSSTTVYGDSFNGGSFGVADGTLATFHVKCYNIDISAERDYTFVKSPTSSFTYNPDFGIKIAREGEDIDSTDMRDFILHSRCQAPTILSVVTDSVVHSPADGTLDISYTNPAGYTAWVFGYGKDIFDSNKWNPAGLYSAAAPRIFLDTDSLFRLNTLSAGGSLIVLRDPLFAATNTVVTY